MLSLLLLGVVSFPVGDLLPSLTECGWVMSASACLVELSPRTGVRYLVVVKAPAASYDVLSEGGGGGKRFRVNTLLGFGFSYVGAWSSRNVRRELPQATLTSQAPVVCIFQT